MEIPIERIKTRKTPEMDSLLSELFKVRGKELRAKLDN